MKLKLIIPVGVLVIGGLSACTAAGTPATAPAAGQQQDTAARQPQEQEEAGEQKEEPLTGDVKDKAEEAALAEYPGTVKKSEHDVENPGMYAVEIEQDAGGEIEVYLDKKFNVVKTKNESGDDD